MADAPYPLLVTGFSAFPGVPVNPTEALMHRLREGAPVAGADLAIHVLPTTYAAVDAFVATHIASGGGGYSAHLAFGVARDPWLRLESCGRNRVAHASADAAGAYPGRDTIAPNGPDRYETPVPLQPLRDELAAANLPVALSDDAGDYLCNYLYYSALHVASTSGIQLPVLFVHVPPLSATCGLDDLERAARICIAYVMERRG